ncbi:hypothetical protein HPB48_003298 [Haemaphysalis longicornis]|uniref:Uncharacterized protein n=1 Tax=Haemaphysalis longicornis TaxID=44386 RepID=A0A9J6H0H7_HAELO|nr:hypothetical protein HPB48_003298 [Haemaphysalis longicornis]
MSQNINCEDADIEVHSGANRLIELPARHSSSASPPQLTHTAVAARSQTSAPPTPSRLPYLAVSGVGALEVICNTDECGWVRDYMAGKMNWSVNPCGDIYAHVCSGVESNPLLFLTICPRLPDVESRAYRERAPGMMTLDVEKFFHKYLNENEQQYHKYPGIFLHQATSFLPKCQSDEKGDKNLMSLRALLEEYNLGDWPYDKSPADVSIATIVTFVDRDLGVFPFARVYLRKPFEADRGYTVNIDAPSLTMKRYNLAYLNESPENFTMKVVPALTLFDSSHDGRSLGYHTARG